MIDEKKWLDLAKEIYGEDFRCYDREREEFYILTAIASTKVPEALEDVEDNHACEEDEDCLLNHRWEVMEAGLRGKEKLFYFEYRYKGQKTWEGTENYGLMVGKSFEEVCQRLLKVQDIPTEEMAQQAVPEILACLGDKVLCIFHEREGVLGVAAMNDPILTNIHRKKFHGFRVQVYCYQPGQEKMARRKNALWVKNET